jgi:hypothetical protein
VFALEVIALAVVLEEGGEAERLRLRVEELQNSSDAGAAAVAGGGAVLEAAHIEFLKRFFQEQVMGVDGASKTYAPNRLRSCLHLLALPPAVLNSLCVVMRQLGAGDAAGDAAASVVTARVVLVPAYLLEASQGKDQLGRYVCIACVYRMCVCIVCVCGGGHQCRR